MQLRSHDALSFGTPRPVLSGRRPLSRQQHLARGWSLASIGVLGGSLSHAVASGHGPSALVVLLCWSLSGMVCTGLAGIRLRAVSTAAGLLLAQGLLHGLLALTGGADVVPAAGTMTTMGHAAHWGHGSLSVHAGGSACATSPAMLLLHGATALLTLWAVRRGDAALAVLADVVRTVLRTVAVLVGGFRPPLPVRPAARPVFTDLVRPNSLARSGPASLRGPPAALRFA